MYHAQTWSPGGSEKGTGALGTGVQLEVTMRVLGMEPRSLQALLGLHLWGGPEFTILRQASASLMLGSHVLPPTSYFL